MNIDFHHAVTYLTARLAGFEHDPAQVIAYAAQYVDDAIDEGVIRFDSGAMYQRHATAHRALNYKNFAALGSRLVWIPYHFMPGNAGLPEARAPARSFIERLVTRPNSHVAQAMMKEVIRDAHRPYGLHRLGIAAHVFVDTWAHQGFAGVNHKINEVSQVKRDGHFDATFAQKVAAFFDGWLHQAVPPIGHGAALSYPDRPFLRWSYVNGLGEHIERDNPRDFVVAADELCRVFRRYRLDDPDAEVEGLSEPLQAALLQRFTEWDDRDERIRHEKWLKALAADEFGIGPVELRYVSQGEGSWKTAALGEGIERERGRMYPYSDSFLRSDWKLFHDAAKAHRRSVVDDVLPRFGICVA